MIDEGLPDVRKIEEIWNLQRIPGREEMFPDRKQAVSDADFIRDSEESDIFDWLLGRKFSEIDDDGSIDALMPLFYLSPFASVYYFGGYLLKLVRHLTAPRAEVCGLAIIHSCCYLGSPKFRTDSAGLLEDQRSIAISVIKEILAVWKRVDLGVDPETAERIGGNLREIVADNHGEG